MKLIRAYLFLRVFLAVFFPILLVVLAVYPLFKRIQTNNTAFDEIAASYSSISRANQLGQYIIDAETGVRGFALTGMEALLEPYFTAQINFQRTVDELSITFKSDPVQLARLTELEQDFIKWRRDFAEQEIQLTRSQQDVSALIPEGKAEMDKMRKQLRTIIQQSTEQLNQGKLAQANISQTSMLIASIGITVALVLGLILAATVAYSLSKSIQKMIAVARKVEGGDLSQRVEIKGKDEIAQLARAFNAMAQNLQQKVNNELNERKVLNQRVEALVDARTRESKQISHFSEMLQACQTFDEAAEVVRQTALHLFKTDAGALYYLQQQDMKQLTSWNQVQSADSCNYDDCWSMRRGKLHQLSNQGTALPCKHLTGPVAAALCIPLLAKGDVVGFFHLQAPATLPDYQATSWLEQNVDLAVTMAEHIALALANITLHNHLREQSLRDPLTGLFNRRYLEEAASRELQRAERNAYPLAVLVLDVDHFKRFNDEYGHQAGDEILIHVADELQEHFRGDDVVCRFGGEEFVALLPNISEQQALQRAEQLRSAIEHSEWLIDGKHLRVTVSIGSAIFPEHASDLDSLINLADEALYQAKNTGRNKVVSHMLAAHSHE